MQFHQKVDTALLGKNATYCLKIKHVTTWTYISYYNEYFKSSRSPNEVLTNVRCREMFTIRA